MSRRQPVVQMMEEPLQIHGLGNAAARRAKVAELLDLVALPETVLDRIPRSLSGGQRQRVSIVRVLALDPALLIADEPMSALDVSVRAQIVNVFARLQERLGLTIAIVAGNLAIVRVVCSSVTVMYLGRVAEEGRRNHCSPTRRFPIRRRCSLPCLRLIRASRPRNLPARDPPSPRNPPPGCRFSTRCPVAEAACRVDEPALRSGSHGGRAACLLANVAQHATTDQHVHAPDEPTALHARIRSGEWRPGTRIPSEHELMEEWRCARATVSKALSALATEGMVTCNRRAGNVVARPRINSAILTIPDVRAEVEARGAAYAHRLLSDELRPPCCVHLGAEGHHLGESRFLRVLHLSDAQPLMVEDRHVFLDPVPEARTTDFTVEPPGSWLVRRVPWTQAEHRIAVVAAETSVARALEQAHGAPILMIECRTWRGPDTVTIVRQWFRGDAFDLTARFAPPS